MKRVDFLTENQGAIFRYVVLQVVIFLITFNHVV